MLAPWFPGPHLTLKVLKRQTKCMSAILKKKKWPSYIILKIQKLKVDPDKVAYHKPALFSN